MLISGGLGGVVSHILGRASKGGHFVHLALPRRLYKETTSQARLPGQLHSAHTTSTL